MSAPAASTARRPALGELGRLVRFGCVGLANTALTAVAFAGLCALGVPGPLASALGFCAGAACGWQLNARWTFAARRDGRRRTRYLAVQALVAGLSALGVALALGAGLTHDAAEGATLVPVTLANYALVRGVVFA